MRSSLLDRQKLVAHPMPLLLSLNPRNHIKTHKSIFTASSGGWKMTRLFISLTSSLSDDGSSFFHYFPFRFHYITFDGSVAFCAHSYLQQMCSHLLDCELSRSLVPSIYLNYGNQCRKQHEKSISSDEHLEIFKRLSSLKQWFVMWEHLVFNILWISPLKYLNWSRGGWELAQHSPKGTRSKRQCSRSP